MSPYSDTTSNNSSPERRGGATSYSTLPTKFQQFTNKYNLTKSKIITKLYIHTTSFFDK